MVTASEGSPSRVTKKPLTAPSTAPSSRHSGMTVSSGSPANHSWPMTALDSRTVLATDRSISPVTMTRVSGSAMSTMTTTSSSRKPVFRADAKPSTDSAATRTNSTSTNVMTASPLPSRRSRDAARGRCAPAWPAGVAGVVSTATEVPPSQAAGQPQGQRPVEHDGGQDQRADGGLPPERVQPQLRQRRADGGQQQRAERRAVDRAAAAEDGHAAYDGGRDDEQLLAGAGRGVQRLEAGGVHDPGQPGQRAADHERREHPPSDRDAREPRGVRVAADPVQLAAAAVAAQDE